MDNVVWLIQTGSLRYDNILPLWEAIASIDDCVAVEAVVRPFVDSIENLSDVFTEYGRDAMILPYGSCKLVKLLESHNMPTSFYDADAFDTTTPMQYRTDMLNSRAITMTLGDLPTMITGEPIFIKPVSVLKDFIGMVVETPDDIVSLVGSNVLPSDTGIIVAPALPIECEIRCFIIDGEVVTASYYRKNGKPFRHRVVDPDTLHVCRGMANDWLPNQTCVMDVCNTPDGWKVVEFNPFNASGFYDCDIHAIVLAMNRYVRKLYEN